MQRIVHIDDWLKETPNFLQYTPNKYPRQNVSIYGWLKDNEIEMGNTTACHSGFHSGPYSGPKNTKYAWNGFIKYSSNQPIIKFCTNPEKSPWRSVLDNSILIINDKKNITDIFIDSKQNGYIACNLFIGVRLGTEHKLQEKWENFIKLGIKPNLALALTNYISQSEKSWKFIDQGSWHKPFNHYEFSVKKFLNAKPLDKPDSSIKTGTYHYHCNHIWKGDDSVKSLIEEFSKETTKQTSKFNNEGISNPSIKNDEELLKFQQFIFDKFNIKD